MFYRSSNEPTIILPHDPKDQVGDPVGFSKNKSMVQKHGVKPIEDDLNLQERERLRGMMQEEIRRYKDIVMNRYSVDAVKLNHKLKGKDRGTNSLL
jgi:hypothetical protein